MKLPFDMNAGAGLAPMAGVTDFPMRRTAYAWGAEWAVSEMLSAKGYCYSPDNRNALNLILLRGAEPNTGLQLFGHEPKYLTEAAKRLEGIGFGFIDIHMGCPMPKIVSNGDGSALMKDPGVAAVVVRAVRSAVSCPVTVKIRSGWDEDHINAVEIAKIAESEGADAVTVHPRTRCQLYTGRADRAVIRAVKEAVSIPVIGNGDITSPEDAMRMKRETGCDGVMVGRGAQGDPFLFRAIREAFAGKPVTPVPIEERVETARSHLHLHAEVFGESAAACEMRKHIAWYMRGERGCAQLRSHVNTMKSVAEIDEALLEYLSEAQPEDGRMT